MLILYSVIVCLFIVVALLFVLRTINKRKEEMLDKLLNVLENENCTLKEKDDYKCAYIFESGAEIHVSNLRANITLSGAYIFWEFDGKTKEKIEKFCLKKLVSDFDDGASHRFLN